MNRYICKNCEKNFYSYNKEAKFCSKSCSTKKNWTGRNHTEKTIQKMRKSIVWQYLDEIVKLYQNGKSIQEIANLKGFNRYTIRTIFRRIGLKMRPPHARKGQKSWNKGKPYYAIRGNKNWKWKGGITNLNQQIRHCIEMKNWKRKVREKDNYVCQICGKRGGNNEVDHYPKSFSQIIKDNNINSYQSAQKCDELWDIDNGRTICLNCHNKTKRNSK